MVAAEYVGAAVVDVDPERLSEQGDDWLGMRWTAEETQVVTVGIGCEAGAVSGY